jgi:Na+/melibiose symporter-like transporter
VGMNKFKWRKMSREATFGLVCFIVAIVAVYASAIFRNGAWGLLTGTLSLAFVFALIVVVSWVQRRLREKDRQEREDLEFHIEEPGSFTQADVDALRRRREERERMWGERRGHDDRF